MITKGKKLSTALCLVLFVVLAFAGLAYAQATDIQGHWAESQINSWTDQGLAKGYQDGTFKPNNSITRAEFITLVNRAFDFNETVEINFTDVKSTDWFAGEIAKAKAVGYVGGYSDGSIKPNNQITRQEAASMLARILQLDTSNVAAVANFKDAQSIPQWSKGSIGAVVAKGYMGGYPDQTFKPTRSITRAEAIVTLDRAIGGVKAPEPKPEPTPEPAPTPTIPSTYDEPGTYGPEKEQQVINDDVTISEDGVTLRNTTIKGDLTLAKGIGDGDVTLKNVVVEGKTYIYGGGENSITLDNCELAETTVDKEDNEIRLILKDTTIDKLIANSGMKLEGDGKITDLTINVDGVEVEIKPVNEPKLKRGVEAIVAGKEVRGSSSGGGGGGGGGGSSTPVVSVSAINDITVIAGSDATVKITTNPADAKISKVTSSKTDVATIASYEDKTIKIEGKAAGTTEITVAVGKSGYKTAEKTFSVNVVAKDKPLPAGKPVAIPKTVEEPLKFESGVELDLSAIVINEGVTVAVTELEDYEVPDVEEGQVFKTSGKVVKIEFDGNIDFSQGVELALPFEGEGASVGIFCYDEVAKEWKYVDSVVEGNVVKATVYHFSTWAPFEASQVKKPTADPNGGQVAKGTKVELSTDTSGASIYYTTDGNKLTTKYTEPIVIQDDVTIKAIAVKGNMRDSGISEFAFTVKPSEDIVSAISVEGVAKVGESLTAKVTPDKATVDYQWMRSDSENEGYVPIEEATGKTYELVAADVGKYIKVKATGTGNYTGMVESEPVGPVKAEEEDPLVIEGSWNATGRTGFNTVAEKAYVFQEFELLVDGERISLHKDNVKSITSNGKELTPNTDHTLWFNVLAEAGEREFVVVDNDGVTYKATLDWKAPAEATATAEGEPIRNDELKATYQKYNVAGVDLVNFDAMYQIKPGGEISKLTSSGDNCLWFKVDADEEGWKQEEGDHIFLVKHGDVWSKFVVNYKAEEEPVVLDATWNDTGKVGTNTIDETAYVFQGFELLDCETNAQIALVASNIAKMTVLAPGAEEAKELEVGDDSDPLLWFNVRKASGEYKYTVETKDGDVYEATLTWMAPVTATAEKTGEPAENEERKAVYQLYTVAVDVDPEYSKVYQIKPNGEISELAILTDSDNHLNIWFKIKDTANDDWKQLEGEHTFLIKKGDAWSEAVINYQASEEPVIVEGSWNATGRTGFNTVAEKAYVFQEFELLVDGERISLHKDNVKSITSNGKELTPNTDHTLWFNVLAEAGEREFVVVDNDGVNYKATLDWKAPKKVTATAEGEPIRNDELKATYQKYNVAGVDLVNFDAMYQIKPGGEISKLTSSGDNCLWFKVDADEEGWKQEEGDHIFLVKHGDVWSKFIVSYKAEEAPEDTEAPKLGEVTLTNDEEGNLVLTVKATDNGELACLEVDHSLDGQGVPEFEVGTEDVTDKTTGASSTFKDGIWTLNFGKQMSALVREKAGDTITFYFVIKDVAGNQFGDMYDVTDEMTVTLEVPVAPAYPVADFEFTKPDSIVEGSEEVEGFKIKVSNVDNIADDVKLRYLMEVVDGSNSLDGKEIGYGDPEVGTFTIQDGKAHFGPSAGFVLAEDGDWEYKLPALKGAEGVTTPFTVKDGLEAGTYKFTVSLVEVDGDLKVTSEAFEFTVAAQTDPVQEALDKLVAETSMTVEEQANGFTASFDKAIEVPEVIEGYYIDVLVTLEEGLTDGKVTILYNGKETAAKEIKIKETEIWLSELVLGGEPAEFKSGPAATWTILVTDNEEAVTVKGAIKSIISSDGFKDEKVVLAEGSFEFTIGVEEATEEETMETIPVVIDTKETVVTQVKVADEINEEITEEPKEEVVSEESDKKNVDETTSGQEQISETEIDEEDADDTQVNQADVIEEDEVE
ncbi:S-layer homology domain-containing protein [Peptococcaceae bacterium 1198_IL3148]